MELFINRISKGKQFIVSILSVLTVAAFCYTLSAYMGYKVVAFALLVTVSILAVTLDILPVLSAAVLSAIVWDFFFIPPHFTLYVKTTEDVILLLMYFVIALVNAVLTYKIRQIDKIARQKEEKANTIKLYNTLLNSLSHELRTPISTIIAATDNLSSSNGRLTDVHKSELIYEISKASMRLNQQVENLLNMSRLEAGVIKPKTDWCDIAEMIYDTVKSVEENNTSRRINININPGIPLFKLDKGMTEQVIHNLLNNAVSYTSADSKIDIVATAHTDVLEITVEDNGPGFPNDEIAYVFNKFYRLKNAAAGGTGLGLSIVKGFVEAQGGTVSLANVPTGGAQFRIEIKAQASYLKP